MNPWSRLVGSRPIVVRLVVTVAVAMAVVLACGAAFVFWRVQHALDAQLDQDLHAYREVAENAVENGKPLVQDTPGLTYQIYSPDGRVIGGSYHDEDPLVSRSVVADAAASHSAVTGQTSRLLPPDEHPYQYVVAPVRSPHGPVIVAYAISRKDHDEALRELLVQLVIADLATLVAASFVGYRTARAALDPVERYRRVAAGAGEDDRLPVPAGDDELARLGHTFNALLDRIEQGARRERQFLADASHELRSPLTVMRAEVDWALLRRDDRGIQQDALESVGRQVQRLVHLCNSLLELEELRAVPATPADPVSLVDLVDGVMLRWQSAAAAKGRELHLRLPEHLVVRGNAHWLDLAVDNLVSNALRYGEGTVTAGADAETVGGAGSVALWVRDEGPGFPDDFVDRAFDRFARAEKSRAGGGTGLGLALVAAVAENHGGSVDINGSRVTLHLPAGSSGPSGG